MDNYEEKFNILIEPHYGNKRDFMKDNELLQSNILPHKYNVPERVDMTMYNTYSIDPDGCEDADDAFSIFEEHDKMFLAIHIADPTYYIEMNSMLWHDILKRAITHYPSNNKPINMLPQNILEKSSLMTDKALLTP